MKETALVLVNPAAGSGAGRRVREKLERLLQGRLSEYKGQLDLAFTDPAGPVQQARESASHYSRIIAVGGDGTASQIIRGIVESGSRTSFGLLPLGTGNDLARVLGTFPPMLRESEKGLAAALHSCLTGKILSMDLLEMEGAGVFINYAGYGLDAAVLTDYLAGQKGGKLSFLRGSRSLRFLFYGYLFLRHLFYRLPPGLEIHLEGNDPLTNGAIPPCMALIIGNIPYYAGGFTLHTGADPADGLFEVILIRGALDAFRVLLARFAPLQLMIKGLCRAQTNRLTWSAPPGIPFQLDGELHPSPLPPSGTIKVAGQISVLVPSS
jgi:diacylglycerol kinase family enzyme